MSFFRMLSNIFRFLFLSRWHHHKSPANREWKLVMIRATHSLLQSTFSFDQTHLISRVLPCPTVSACFFSYILCDKVIPFVPFSPSLSPIVSEADVTQRQQQQVLLYLSPSSPTENDTGNKCIDVWTKGENRVSQFEKNRCRCVRTYLLHTSTVFTRHFSPSAFMRKEKRLSRRRDESQWPKTKSL